MYVPTHTTRNQTKQTRPAPLGKREGSREKRVTNPYLIKGQREIQRMTRYDLPFATVQIIVSVPIIILQYPLLIMQENLREHGHIYTSHIHSLSVRVNYVDEAKYISPSPPANTPPSPK